MTTPELLITIAACALATAFTRFVPFWLFPEGKKMPPLIEYLSGVLPYAVMGLLVVYCLKGVNFLAAPHGIPEAVAVSCVVLVHLWRHNVLISIATGTVVYMLLIQFLFT